MRTILFAMLTGWAIAFFGSFYVFYLTTGAEGGLGKLSNFLVWQAIAIVLTIACLVMRWSTKDEVERRLAAIPSLAVGVLVVISGSIVVVTNLKAGVAGAEISTLSRTDNPASN